MSVNRFAQAIAVLDEPIATETQGPTGALVRRLNGTHPQGPTRAYDGPAAAS